MSINNNIEEKKPRSQIIEAIGGTALFAGLAVVIYGAIIALF